MIFKKLQSFTGPVRYEFTDPDTGFYYKAPDLKSLIQHIVTYRSQNELEPIENLDVVLENYWCQKPVNSSNCCEVELKRGFLGYLKGGIALTKMMLFKTTVPKAEADRRASICVGCPKNIIPSPEYKSWADDLAEQMVGDLKSSYHDQLGHCECCSCLLRAAVFYKGDMHVTRKEKKCMPDFCWKLDGK